LGTIGCAALLLALGCGSGAPSDDGGGSDPGDVRTLDRRVAPGLAFPSTAIPPRPGDVGDVSAVVGHWFVNRGTTRLELDIRLQSDRLTGTAIIEGSSSAPLSLEQVTWDRNLGQLRFRMYEEGEWLAHALHVVEGTLIGRYTADEGSPAQRKEVRSGHWMGWRRETFDGELVPRVFDIVVDDGRFARLRIDRDPIDPTLFTGEFKLKATASRGSDGELPAQPIFIRRWDGEQLVFDMPNVPNGTVRQRFNARIQGRNVTGTMSEGAASTVKFAGTRANVLAYGLSVKSVEERRDWQERVRRILYRLMMAGNPLPLSTQVTVTERPLFPVTQVHPLRDDNLENWPQDYRLSDVVFQHTLPNPYGEKPLTRQGHGFLAVPQAAPPPEGYGVVLALNGHGGSAQHQMQSDGDLWYGDSFARRGYMVLAIDVSHRPPHESGGIYADPVDGDSPETGNHAHPAIAAPGYDSDWADDGERVWDAMRGIDFLLAQPSANPNRIIVAGLSLGGEVAAMVGALDPRVTTAIPASAPPDFSMVLLHGNHPCWKWVHGDATEFVEMSDFLSLNAPRRLVVESGKQDWTYSSYALPYALEKENAWRGRIAYGDQGASFVHYIHSSDHQFRVGDSSIETPYPVYIQVPQQIAPPGTRRRSADWEVDGATISLNQTLFDFLAP
jgi:hypothetical protein